MGALTLVLAIALAAVHPPDAAMPDAPPSTHVQPPIIARWHLFMAEASQRFGIPEDWIAAVMAAESAGATMRDGRPIVSRAGAMGLMQVMPATWEAMRGRYGLGGNPHDPRDNILAGAAYLRLMHDRFGYPGLFGAYNAGATHYAEHLATGRALPAETRAYVARLAGQPTTAAMPPAILSGERLFVTLRGARETGDGVHDAAPSSKPNDALFVPLTTSPSRER